MPRDLFAENEMEPSGNDLFTPNKPGRDLFAGNNSQQEAPQNDFASKMENFYRASGIHGANRGFAKVFGFGKHRENAEQNYQNALRTNPNATALGNVLSQVYSSIPFILAGGAAAGAIPKVGNTLKNVIGAAGGAGAMGAFAHPEEGETRGGNALKDALIAGSFPVAGKVIGMGAKSIGNTVKKVVPNLNKSITKNKAAESVGNSFREAKDKYKDLYDDLFKEAKSANVKTDLKPINKRITKGIDPDTVKALEKALQTNSPKHVNQAQSKLGEYIRAEQKIKRSGGRIDPLALDKAKKIQKTLNKELDTAFSKSSPDLAKRYSEIKSGYKKEVVPYSRNRAIQEFDAGEIVGEDLIRALRGHGLAGKSFRKHLADAHPEVKINQVLGNIGKAGLGASGLYGGYKYFAD